MTRHETATRKIQTTIWMKKIIVHEKTTLQLNISHINNIIISSSSSFSSSIKHDIVTAAIVIVQPLTTTHPWCHANPSCCMAPLRHHLSAQCSNITHTHPPSKKDTSMRNITNGRTHSPMNASLTFHNNHDKNKRQDNHDARRHWHTQ
mmetsp:Transcript_54422/g.61577  ORF Transcript_54422/g.61577 Transcript_54422/m.61577 type:complete len:148 (-) Transcript_54422:50-493(-)